MDFRDRVVVFLELIDELSRVKFTVRPASLDDLALLLNGEVLPFKRRADMLLEQSKNFVVRNGTRVGLKGGQVSEAHKVVREDPQSYKHRAHCSQRG